MQAAERHLAAKRCTLWSSWDISDPDRRRLAAEWLVDQCLGLQEQL